MVAKLGGGHRPPALSRLALALSASLIVVASAAACGSSTGGQGAAAATTTGCARGSANGITGTLAGKYTDPGYTLYVANAGNGTVTPVNLADNRPEPGIRIPGVTSVVAAAITPNGQKLYIANNGGFTNADVAQGTTVYPIDVTSRTVGQPIQAGLGPFAIAVTPDGRRAYVADMGSFDFSALIAAAPAKITPQLMANLVKVNDAQTLTPIDVASDQPGKAINVGPGPGAVAITPDGKYAFVADSGTPHHPQGYVARVDLATGTTTGPLIRTGIGSMGVAITPSGKWAYIANTGWWNKAGDTISPIDLATLKVGAPIKVGTAPLGIAITPDGKELVTANYGYGYPGGGTVTPVDLATGKAGKAIRVGPAPDAITIAPNGRVAFVAVGGLNNTVCSIVVPVDLTTGQAGPPIRVGPGPSAVVIGRTPAKKG